MTWCPEEINRKEFFDEYYSHRKYDTETYLYYKESSEIPETTIDKMFDEQLRERELERWMMIIIYKVIDLLNPKTDEEKELINHICFCMNTKYHDHYCIGF